MIMRLVEDVCIVVAFVSSGLVFYDAFIHCRLSHARVLRRCVEVRLWIGIVVT